MSDCFEPVAIVGAAGRFPGARDLGEYWANLAAGRETLTALTDEQLLSSGLDPHVVADPAYVKRAGLLPDVEMFDAGFFGMSPREADICDPQLRVFLETVHQVIEDAGYDSTTMDRDVAVFGACGPNAYGDRNVRADPDFGAAPDMRVMVLNNVDYLATLASYKLDLRGPSMAVLTACSSSLTAVQLACRALQIGDCDAAVAGASNIEEVPHPVGYRWSPGDVRSADGFCRPFDASGTGTIFTSGAGAVLLKRLSDAVADGDHVRGVVHGIGITNDGRNKVSFSAPSVSGQSAAVVDAMASAGFHPDDIGCVEMHATGTPLGDPIEMSALAAAYRTVAGDGPLAPGRIPVGSVKGNIGHTVPVAGLAGLLKLLLALEHERIPPTVGVTAPNPALELAGTPFVLADRLRPWPRTAAAPRRAGLSSLGIGGTNVHLILEEGPAPVPTPHRGRPRIVVWSGRDAAAAAANRAVLAEHFAGAGDDPFAGAVATLRSGRTAHAVRGAVVCAGPAEAAAALAADRGHIGPGEQAPTQDPPAVVLAFPGQGSQAPRMAAGLYGVLPEFTETIDECFELLAGHGDDLQPLWLDPDPAAALQDTANVQPLLFAVEYALARQLIEWCGRPAAVVGHSVGELVAATVAGVFELPDALRLVRLRGRFMQECPAGAMLAVAAGTERIATVLDGHPLAVAAVNAADQTVLAGPQAAVGTVAEALAAAGIGHRPLRTSHAFHSPAMRSAADRLRAEVAAVATAPPRIPLHSAGSGALLRAEDVEDPGFWSRQVAEPVLFGSALDDLDAAGAGGEARVVVETGPGSALTGIVRRHAAVRSGRWVALPLLPWRRGAQQCDDHRDVLAAVAELWTRGVAVAWPELDRDERPQRTPVPGYRFQRARHWIDPPARAAACRPDPDDATVRAPASGTGDADTGDVPCTVPGWVEQPRSRTLGPTPAAGSALLVAPDDPAAAGAIAEAVELGGYSVQRIGAGESPGDRPGAGDAPALLVHAAGAGARDPAGDDAAELDALFGTLHELVRTAGRRPVAGRLPDLLVVTSSAVDVSGCETVRPARAGLVAAALAYGLETPEITCRVIDVGRSAPGAGVPELAREIAQPGADLVVALRGSRRWLPVQRPWAPPPGAEPPLRDGGCYLVTGGLGGLGVALARGLAATGRRPGIALLSRGGDLGPADLTAIEQQGARVRVAHADVADPAALATAWDEVERELGPVTGVFHLAGVAGDGMLQFRDPERSAHVMRPKVRGTAVLAAELDRRPPVDFVVGFSSRAALTGMIGGADYAAANAFLDAFAAGRAGWRSINWPGWSSVGMARGGALETLSTAVARARSAPPRPGTLLHDEVVSAATHWELDEHRIAGAAVLPGTAVAELVLRAYLAAVPGAAAPVTLRDVAFLRPLGGDPPQRVRVVLAPAGDGRWQATVRSAPAAGTAGAGGDVGRDGTGWTEHATATVEAGGAPARTVAVDDLTAGMPEIPPPSLRPSPGDTFVFGPRWHNIRRLWESDAAIVTRLELAPPFAGDAEQRPLHPALLDTGSGVLRRRRPGALVVPSTYESLTWYGRIPRAVFGHVRVRAGAELLADVDVVTPDGVVVVAIEGLRMRSVAADVFAAAPHVSGNDLAPDAGIALLWRLLAGGPARVAVLPVSPPGSDAAGAPSTAPSGAAPIPPAARSGPSAAAASSVQDRLADMWRQILGKDRIEPTDDFFELGGDSLMGVALTGWIRDAFGVHLSIGSLFDYPDLRSLADALREQGAR